MEVGPQDQNVVRTWYGLQAEVDVENHRWHRVRVGRLRLNHPPLVSLVVRREVPNKDRLRLSFFHEFGHLQTLPLAVAHVVTLVWLGRHHKDRRRGVLRTLALVLAHQTTWELASETYVLMHERRNYIAAYRKSNPWIPLLFWSGVIGSIIFLNRWLTTG